jgi:hypothetical protein
VVSELPGNFVSVSTLKKLRPQFFNELEKSADLSNPTSLLKPDLDTKDRESMKNALFQSVKENNDVEMKSENKSIALDHLLQIDKQPTSKQSKPHEDMFSSDEEMDDAELKRIKHKVMESRYVISCLSLSNSPECNFDFLIPLKLIQRETLASSGP